MAIQDTKTVQQYITLYNVTGYIEKENNLYFSPRPQQMTGGATAGTTKSMCQWYMDYFNTVIGVPSTAYQNVEVSRWSPSDRTLSVQGTVDLFRKSGLSSDSKAFNYLIVKRVVSGTDTEYTYYMGYFITDVRQTGTNTVALTLEIDNFTNAFYLMNTKVYSISELNSLDIFNETLVNCNVERQHYDRVTKEDNTIKISNNEIFLNPLESYDYKYQKKVSKLPIIASGIDVVDTFQTEQTFESQTHYSEFVVGREYIFMPSTFEDPNLNDFRVSFAPYSTNPGGQVIIRVRSSDGVELNSYVVDYMVMNENTRPQTLFINGYAQIDFHDLVMAGNYLTIMFGSYRAPIRIDPISSSYNNFDTYFNQINYYLEITTHKEYSFTKEEYELISSTSNFNTLSLNLKRKCVKASISYLLIKSKESLSAGYAFVDSDSTSDNITWRGGFLPNRTHGYLSGNVIDPLFTYVVPILNIPRFLRKFENDLSDIDVTLYVRSGYYTSNEIRYSDYQRVRKEKIKATPTDSGLYSGRLDSNDLVQVLGESDWSDVIISASIIKDLPIDLFNVSYTTYNELSIYANVLELESATSSTVSAVKQRNYNLLSSLVLPKGIWLGIIPSSKSNTEDQGNPAWLAGTGNALPFLGAFVSRGTSPTSLGDGISPIATAGFVVYQLSGLDSKIINLDLEESDKYTSISTLFFEPLLEMNPYTFYSISYTDGIEVPLNKQKYYNLYDNTNNVYKTEYLIIYSNNDAQKLGCIPYYTINGYSELYYMDGLVTTISSQLPMNSDSYVSYYTQNLAQMKNQFAVNNYQRGTDLLQTFFNTAPAQVGAAFVGKGKDAGYAEIIKQVSGMIDMGIDWAQSNNVITMNQKAQLAGAGAKPDVVKQAGSDIAFDIEYGSYGLFLNYYRIDDFSYNSIAKGLERFGYLVNRYDTLHVYDRRGWNYVKLISADFNHYGNSHLNLTNEQENDIINIFKEGVTLLHEPQFLYDSTKHNYEVVVD